MDDTGFWLLRFLSHQKGIINALYGAWYSNHKEYLSIYGGMTIPHAHIIFFFYSDTSEQGIISEYNLILASF